MTELKYSIFNGMLLECAESLGNAMLSNMVGGWLGMYLHVIWNMETHSKSDSIPFHDYFMAFQSTINRPSKFSTNQPRAGQSICTEAFDSVFMVMLMFFQTLMAGDSWGDCAVPMIQKNPLSIIIFGGSGGWSLSLRGSGQVIIIEVLKGHVIESKNNIIKISHQQT